MKLATGSVWCGAQQQQRVPVMMRNILAAARLTSLLGG